jgi:hypothetical protein
MTLFWSMNQEQEGLAGVPGDTKEIIMHIPELIDPYGVMISHSIEEPP